MQETPIYALGQPTTDAVEEAVRRIRLDYPQAGRILWITLREEPVRSLIGPAAASALISGSLFT
jgi:hypothetical protein